MALLRNRWGWALLAAIVIRLGLVAIAQSFPEGGVIVDSRAYLDLASAIRQAGWSGWGRGELHWTPGYPVFILLGQALSGTSFVGVGFFQLVLTGLAAILLWWIGYRLGDRCAGMAAAWLYLLSPSAGLWSLTIMSESLFAFLLVLALAFLVLGMTDGRAVGWALAGATLAIAALVRPIGLPLVALWALLALTARTPTASRISTRLGVGLFLAGAALAVAPWVIRNWRVTGAPVFAEVPANTLVRFNLAYVVAEAEGITRDEAAARLSGDLHSWQDALAIIRRYPSIFVGQQLQGLRRSVIGVESGVWARQFGYGLERQGSLEVLSILFQGEPALALARLRQLLEDRETAVLAGLSLLGIAHTGSLYLLGLLGAIPVVRRGGAGRVVYLLAGLTTVFLLVSPGAAGQARFRIPVEPYLALFAGAGLCVLYDWVRKNRRRRPIRGPASPTAASEKDGSEAQEPPRFTLREGMTRLAHV
jgi:4-amino-4-deoxy-L-arabinose transferase-like glycosyltransferase